eukprot:7062_1
MIIHGHPNVFCIIIRHVVQSFYRKMVSVTLIFALLANAHYGSESVYDCGGNYDVFDSKVIASIQSKGYHIDEGSFWWLTNQSSYAANPSLYYTLWSFPKNHTFLDLPKITYDASNSFDDSFAANIDPSHHSVGTRGHMRANMTYFMYGSSGVVWYGCLPPSDYYAFKMYQNRRYNPLHPGANDSQHNNEKYPISHSYSSLGDMLNHKTISATKSGLTVIIFTADNNTYSDIVMSIKPYLKQLNLSINHMNLDMMPYQHVPIEGPGYGTGEEERTVNMYYLKYGEDDGFMKQILKREPLDSFSIMGRSGLPRDGAAFAKYLNTKQRVYKIYLKQNVSDAPMDKPRQPFAPPFISNTSTGIYEQDTLQPYFTSYVDAVYKYFSVHYRERYMWRYKNVKISRPGYMNNNHFGFNCLKYGTRCMADNRDSQYYVSWPDVEVLTNTSIFFVIGVSHQATKKAQWENIVPMFQNNGFEHKFYRSHYLDYLADKYINSSLTFPPKMNQSIPMDVLDKFFVIAAMRPAMCSKYFDSKRYPELNKIPKFCFDGNDYGYNESQNMFFVHRNYINALTNTRPNANEMIPFVVMQFETQWFDFNTA